MKIFLTVSFFSPEQMFDGMLDCPETSEFRLICVVPFSGILIVVAIGVALGVFFGGILLTLASIYMKK